MSEVSQGACRLCRLGVLLLWLQTYVGLPGRLHNIIFRLFWPFLVQWSQACVTHIGCAEASVMVMWYALQHSSEGATPLRACRWFDPPAARCIHIECLAEQVPAERLVKCRPAHLHESFHQNLADAERPDHQRVLWSRHVYSSRGCICKHILLASPIGAWANREGEGLAL